MNTTGREWFYERSDSYGNIVKSAIIIEYGPFISSVADRAQPHDFPLGIELVEIALLDSKDRLIVPMSSLTKG
jgi:hypothetical protein